MSFLQRPAILFVCLGNICRSPLAEAAFRREAEAAEINIDVDSVGTGHWHVGNPPDRRAQAIASHHGIDISGYRARQIERADFYRFTKIFALDHENLSAVRAIAPPDAVAETGLLLDLVIGREGEAVIDPYYGDAAGFEMVWEDVSAAARTLVSRLL